MGTNKKLPSDEILIELLKKHKTVIKVLKVLDKTYTSCQRLVNLARENDIELDKTYHGFKGNYKGKLVYEENLASNKYKELDNFTLGQVVHLKGHTWVIEAINKGTRKLYHCYEKLEDRVNRESFDCLQLRRI